MKAQTADVLGLCKDESNTKRLVRNLSAQQANQADALLSGVFQNWVEEQIKTFSESCNLGTSIPDTALNTISVEPSSEHANAINVAASITADKTVVETGLASGLEGLTFGGIPIGVKVKQQKKRMKPNLVNEKPVHNSVLGNINSQTNEATDIRLEMKYAAVPIMLSKYTAPTPPLSSVLISDVVKEVPAEKVNKAEPTCSGPSCAQCRAKEDLPAVLRLATIYGTLVNYQHISLLKALGTIQLLTCMDPHRCGECFVQVCSQETAPCGRHSLTAGALLINAACMKAFVRSLLEKCIYVITNCGTAIANEIMESAIVRSWVPELAVKMKDILSINASASAPGLDVQSTVTNFKLPETFLKPFREDYDSKNEYKTQAELAIFYERERAFDELSNLYYRFQAINRSDLDGSALTAFLRTDLVRTGTAVLMLRDCNYLWFAELFMGLMLFHGCSTSTALPHSPVPSDRAVTAHAIDASPSRTGLSPSPGIKAGGLSTERPNNLGFGAGTAAPGGGTVEYSANFPSLSAIKSLPLDVSKHSKLEERLGVGGEVKQVLFSQTPTSTTFRSTPSTTTGSTGQASGSGGYKGKNPRKPTVPYQSQQSPQPHGAAASDAYEAPSAHFGGSQQFFFRFIVLMNNHRFNQSLLTCILAEVTSLLRNETFAAASSVNFEMGSPAKGKGISMFLPTYKTSNSARQESSRDFFISPEDFALKVTKLKLLGRFLGLLHFYHRWAETSSTALEIGPLQKLALRLSEKRSVLRESLPVLAVLQQSKRAHTLSLSVPWVCAFLNMMSFDAACVGMAAPADPQSGRVRDRCSDLVPYFDVLAYLHDIQFGDGLQPLGSKLSSNRLFVAMEIQGLWQSMPTPVKSAVTQQSSVVAVSGSTADASEHAGADEEQDMALDDQHLAFTTQFLRHVTPYLEPLYQSWKKRRAEQAQLTSPKHHAVLQVKKKRQTPSVVTSETIAFTQSLVNAPGLPEPPAVTVASHAASANIAMTISKPMELSVVLPPPAATPTKAKRSMSSGSAPCDTPPPRTAKSPRKLSSAALTAMNKLDNSNGAFVMKSPTKSSANRIRNTSFESISPAGMHVPSSPRHTPSQFIDRPVPGSATNSITTSGRSSPATTLYSKSRQRSLSDLNNPLSLRLSGVSPSPLKSASPGLHGTPVKLGEFGLIGNESSDVLERLEIAFWNDHTSLQEMSNFLLSQTSQACWHHTKELVADGVRELVGSIASLKSERDNHRYEDLLENYMKRVHSDLVKDGEQFIEDYYANFIEKTLPQMCKLYPINPRVVKMAIFFMNRHFRVQKETFCAHLKGYGYRKLRQLCEASNKRKSQTGADGALGAGGTESAVTSTSSRGQPEVLAARRLHCDTQLPAAVNALLRFVTFTSLDEEDLKPEWWSSKCRCAFVHDSLFLSRTSGDGTAVASVNATSLRNNMSLLLSLLTEVSSQLCTLAASHYMRLSAAAGTESTTAAIAAIALVFLPAGELALATGVRCDLNAVLHNTLAVYQAAVAGISAAVHDERLLLSATRRAELQGKVAADLAKFTTSIVPYLLYLDVVFASLQCSNSCGSSNGSSVSALHCLTRYSTQLTSLQDEIDVQGVREGPVLHPLPSDLLHHMMAGKVLSLEIISRTLGLIARAKTAAYYENCKGLIGMKECVSKALLAVVGRIIIRNQDVLGIDMSVLDDEGWYQDSSIRLLVKSNLSETLSTLISTLLVSLQAS